MGLSGGQLLRRVELPLAVPYLAAGLRTAAVQVVATDGAGVVRQRRRARPDHRGRFRARHGGGGGQIVAGGAARRAARAAVEGVLALVERLVTPAPLRRRGAGGPGGRSPRPPATVGPPGNRPGCGKPGLTLLERSGQVNVRDSDDLVTTSTILVGPH